MSAVGHLGDAYELSERARQYANDDLGAIPEYVDEFAAAYEEAYTYGWRSVIPSTR